jgi:hypothetical protein
MVKVAATRLKQRYATCQKGDKGPRRHKGWSKEAISDYVLKAQKRWSL